MRVAAILGTRPEVIKLAPVVFELRRNPETECIVIATGQHREMLDQMLEQFELEADVDLGVMRPDQRLSDLTAELIRGLGGAVANLRPDWVLVQGDTTTTLCGALAAFYQSVPVGHVEAGLRSGDDHSPFPEEANRRLVTRLADLHLCPTPGSAANLIAESVPAEQVYVTGNTVIDALLWAVERARALPPPVPRTRSRRILLTLHRRESQGQAMRQICEVITKLMWRGDTEVVFPVHPSPAVREVVVPVLTGVEGVHLCEPLDYLDFIHVLDSSDLVLTDSGGLQEEAPALGKPVLVLRDTTERPEAVEVGVAHLVGTTPPVVHAAVSRLLDDQRAYRAMAHAETPFGDGHASTRVALALAEGSAVHRAA
jgi:UDP-N-acetylglucosamine 2-epimerase (non-hydrolysing)